MNAQDAPLPEASAQMMQMITGYWITQLTHGMARYSIADHLAEGPKGAQEIAAAEGLNPDACFRFLRACAGLGLVSHDGARFGRTPLSDTLRRGVPGSLRGFALSQPAPGHWLPWGRFPEALKTGEMQTVPALGDPLFDYYGRAPDEAQSFTDAMTGLTMMVAAEAARLIDTSGTALAVDIGGAGGALIMALLDANPRLHGIVFDRPNIVPSVAAMAERAGLQDRVTAVGGDFFEAVPAADLYLLKFILHDWDDALCVKISEELPAGGAAGRAPGRDRAGGGRDRHAEPGAADGSQHDGDVGRARAQRGGIRRPLRGCGLVETDAHADQLPDGDPRGTVTLSRGSARLIG